MKKVSIFILSLILSVSLWALPVYGDDSAVIAKQPLVFSAKSVALSTTETSSPQDLRNARGYFSVQYTITGDGTLTLDYQLSNDGSSWIAPSTRVDSFPHTALTKTTGPGSNGKDILTVKPMAARFIRFTAEETAGANLAIVTLRLSYQ